MIKITIKNVHFKSFFQKFVGGGYVPLCAPSRKAYGYHKFMLPFKNFWFRWAPDYLFENSFLGSPNG